MLQNITKCCDLFCPNFFGLILYPTSLDEVSGVRLSLGPFPGKRIQGGIHTSHQMTHQENLYGGHFPCQQPQEGFSQFQPKNLVTKRSAHLFSWHHCDELSEIHETTVDGQNPAPPRTKDDDYPIIYRVLTIPGGAGFLPLTVFPQVGHPLLPPSTLCFFSYTSRKSVHEEAPSHRLPARGDSWDGSTT